MSITTTTPVTLCCARPETTVRGKRRCSGCGHRQAVNGIPPAQTRDLMLARPVAALWIAVTEMRDRRTARHALTGFPIPERQA